MNEWEKHALQVLSNTCNVGIVAQNSVNFWVQYTLTQLAVQSNVQLEDVTRQLESVIGGADE